MQDEVRNGVSDDELLGALTGTRVAIIADDANIASYLAQKASAGGCIVHHFVFAGRSAKD
jgi:hypothetical protein